MEASAPLQLTPSWAMFAGDAGRLLVLLSVALFLTSAWCWAFIGLPPSRRRLPAAALAVGLAAYGAIAWLSFSKDYYYRLGALSLGSAALGLMLIAIWRWARKPESEAVPARAFVLGCVGLFGAIAALGSLFAGNIFSYTYVYARASATTDLKYKIAGIWAGQEGSFLLWACMSGVFGILAARSSGPYRKWFTVSFAAFLLSLAVILVYESPFRIDPEAWKAAAVLADAGRIPSAILPYLPPDGVGLTPTLQNYWVVIHPPTIFAGFGSLTVMFAWSVAAMLSGNVRDWIPMLRPWALVSLAALGLGLCMGGFWAYETLGWGGFWAWDPVENVSFVPWVFTAILIHGMIVQVNRKKWAATNLFMAGVPFLIFVYGTFMTRSGFLNDQSVHSFAEMNRVALWLLIGFLVLSTAGFVGLWAFRGLKLGQAASLDQDPGKGVHREGVYRSASLLLAALGVATAVGMSVPLIQSIIGQSPKRVEEQAYHFILSWLFVGIIVLMAVGPFVSWRAMRVRELLGRLLNVFSISALIVGIGMILAKRSSWAEFVNPTDTIAFPFGVKAPLVPWIVFLAWLCTFAAVANTWRLVEIWKRGRSSAGAFIAHLGVAVVMAGLIISRGFEKKSEIAFVDKNQSGQALGYTISFKGREIPIESERELLNRNNKLIFDLAGPGGTFEARPVHFYEGKLTKEGEQEQMSWPYIQRSLWHDIYFVVNKEATSYGAPFTLLPGASKNLGDITVNYSTMQMEGKPGTPGTKFTAKISAKDKHGDVFQADPSLQLTATGVSNNFAPVSNDLTATLVSMDARTKAATLQLFFTTPLYLVELYYKPMTILVWVGTGIMTLGGLIAAWSRRRLRRQGATDEAAG